MIILRIEGHVTATRLHYHCIGKCISMALAPKISCCVSYMWRGVQEELVGGGRIKEAHFRKLRRMTSKLFFIFIPVLCRLVLAVLLKTAWILLLGLQTYHMLFVYHRWKRPLYPS